MPREEPQDPRTYFSVRYLPWLLSGVMLGIYLSTLNPWVSLLNLGWVAVVSGWNWQPQLNNPLLALVLLPFHLAPAGKLPLLLNVFSAGCAAAALGLLARCVALLPHDRLETERRRERSDFSLLSGPLAVFPPVLAVALLGLQLTFWQQATNFTGESFELLLFAGILWQLLEYRLDEVPGRLYLAALAGGAGIAEHWAFFGYFPLFVAAIIWLRGADFFQTRFLARLLWSGLGGVALLLLLPLAAVLSGKYSISLWEALRPGLGMHWYLCRLLVNTSAWRQLGMVSLATLLPLLVLSIRWRKDFGDTSGTAKLLVNYLFYLGYFGFLALCFWVMFDPPFSPKRLDLLGSPGLTLYFLAALSLGYYGGFALLIFGKKPQSSRRGAQRPKSGRSQGLAWLSPLLVGGTLAVSAAGLGLLLYKNAPIIRSENKDTLLQYARFATQNLPPGGAILLADVDAAGRQSVHGYLVQAMLVREGKSEKYPVVDTSNLKYSLYHEFLHERYPAIWPQPFPGRKPMIMSQHGIFELINQLAKSNSICYLNPSFGYFFEAFYQEPQGLTYGMKFLPADTLLPPPPDAELIRQNEQFWAEVRNAAGPAIKAAMTAPTPARKVSWGDQMLARLHVSAEPNENAIYAGTLYSLGLDDWGVCLQRAGWLAEAATNFLAAQTFNPDNASAGINLAFNRRLQAGKIPPLDLTRISPEEFGKAHSWQEMLAADGPVDELNFNYEEALILADRGGLLRQSTAPLARLRQLVPDRFDIRQRLATTYLFNHLPDRALEALSDPQRDPDRFSLAPQDRSSLSVLMAAAYFQKQEVHRGLHLLEAEIARQPGDTNLVAATIQACIKEGYYTNALDLIARQLQQTPDDPQWLFARGLANLQSGHYAPAIAALTRTLELATNSQTARFDRGLAYLGCGKLAEARADFLQLQAGQANSFQLAFGLGEIAWRQHDTNEAIRNYQIYLANARTNTAEATNVMERLRDLSP
jgi:tetratricopeptide (TPR) repeat protein